MNTIENAVRYVREHKTWSEEEEKLALRKMNEMRLPLYRADENISNDIFDLMEEFGEENNLPEGWWLSDTDTEEIFLKL